MLDIHSAGQVQSALHTACSSCSVSTRIKGESNLVLGDEVHRPRIAGDQELLNKELIASSLLGAFVYPSLS